MQCSKLIRGIATFAFGLTLAGNTALANAQCGGGNQNIPGTQFTSRGVTYTIAPLKISNDVMGSSPATFSTISYGLLVPPNYDPAPSGVFLAEPGITSFSGLTGMTMLGANGRFYNPSAYGDTSQLNPFFFYSISSSGISGAAAFGVVVRYSTNGYVSVDAIRFSNDDQITITAINKFGILTLSTPPIGVGQSLGGTTIYDADGFQPAKLQNGSGCFFLNPGYHYVMLQGGGPSAYSNALAVSNIAPIAVYGPPVSSVILPGLTQPVSVTIVFMPTGGGTTITKTVTVNPDGSFTFPFDGLPLGEYDLCFKACGFLNKKVHVNLTDDSLGITVTLIPGDINGDNRVDVLDFGLMVNDYGSVKGDPNYDPCADFNNDGAIDVLDFGDLVNNYGEVGDACP